MKTISERYMTNSVKLLALYDEIIVKRYIDEKDAMKEWHDTYKTFVEYVHARSIELKNGKKLDYDNGDHEFLDLFFISNNPVSSRGSNPISDVALKTILRDKEFIKLIEQNMLNPCRESWGVLREKGKDLFKLKDQDDQKLRFNRICAACSNQLIPVPSENAFNKIVKYLSENNIIDFQDVDKNWYAQNEYLTKEIHRTFTNRILDENDFTDEYWLNLFAWSLYDKKVSQSENYTGKSKEANLNQGTEKMQKSLNRILFGAAGTGKTFHSINHALSIIENKRLEILEEEDRTVLKLRFDQYKDQGQIKFVTFHQSFSYEDFVEGIRAETDDTGKLTYDVQAGVFKEICKRAVFKQVSEVHIDKTIDEFVKEISQNEKVLETKTGVEFTVFNSSGKGGISVRTTTQNEIVLSKKAIKNYLLDPSENIRSNQAYAWAVARSIKSKVDEKISDNTDAKLKNFVLIIDEINRGNISRIFGELITLIEDSKRQGAEEELSVTLPYSKEEFSIPSNVYIIGTMNSSDRSLTGLDIALRRRFTFIEMPPKPELLDDISVDGLNIGELLKVINQRVEVLLDRDHCIGHANFMSLKKENTREHLAVIFKQKIIPQLQEYFFDDWSKINMVLNANGMLKAQTVERSVLFPNVNTESEGVFEDQKTWQIVETAFDSIDSFAKIIKH